MFFSAITTAWLAETLEHPVANIGRFTHAVFEESRERVLTTCLAEGAHYPRRLLTFTT